MLRGRRHRTQVERQEVASILEQPPCDLAPSPAHTPLINATLLPRSVRIYRRLYVIEHESGRQGCQSNEGARSARGGSGAITNNASLKSLPTCCTCPATSARFACRRLAEAGAIVYCADASPDGAPGSNEIQVVLDVTDPGGVRALFERVRAEQGRLDVLVNSAGVFPRASALDISLTTPSTSKAL
jgi:hypothetical protein